MTATYFKVISWKNMLKEGNEYGYFAIHFAKGQKDQLIPTLLLFCPDCIQIPS
jgi:hypothetical protein